MKRLFFYSNILIANKSVGITKKVLSQVKTMRKQGYEVYYTGYTDDGVVIMNNNDEVVKCYKYPKLPSKLNRVLRRWYLINSARKFITQTNISFDYSYMRFHYFDASFVGFLKVLKKKEIKVIIEAHGYPHRKFVLDHTLLINILDLFYTKKAAKYIDRVAAISKEPNIWGCQTIQIDNAIILEDVKPAEKRIRDNDNTINLISVSNEREYHGYPKLIRGLFEYYQTGGKINFKIFFVGVYRKETKILVEKLNMGNYITFIPPTHGEELDKLYDQMDLGIGSLEYRAGSEYGSSIKTKEYFAKGLPFINGWKEYAFDDDYKYVKRFELSDKMIDFREITKFYEVISNDKDTSYNMRKFAEENFTWDAQIEKVFNSFS